MMLVTGAGVFMCRGEAKKVSLITLNCCTTIGFHVTDELLCSRRGKHHIKKLLTPTSGVPFHYYFIMEIAGGEVLPAKLRPSHLTLLADIKKCYTSVIKSAKVRPM